MLESLRKIGRITADLYVRFSSLAKWAGSLTVIVGCLSACWGLSRSLHESSAASERLKITLARQEQAREDQVSQVKADLAEVKGDVKGLVGDVGEIKGSLRVLTGMQGRLSVGLKEPN